MRKNEQKDVAVLYDVADDMRYKKKENYTLKHFVERIKIYGEDKKNINFEKYFLLWSPWNTVASWYLWRNIDQEIISY